MKKILVLCLATIGFFIYAKPIFGVANLEFDRAQDVPHSPSAPPSFGCQVPRPVATRAARARSAGFLASSFRHIPQAMFSTGRIAETKENISPSPLVTQFSLEGSNNNNEITDIKISKDGNYIVAGYSVCANEKVKSDHAVESVDNSAADFGAVMVCDITDANRIKPSLFKYENPIESVYTTKHGKRFVVGDQKGGVFCSDGFNYQHTYQAPVTFLYASQDKKIIVSIIEPVAMHPGELIIFNTIENKCVLREELKHSVFALRCDKHANVVAVGLALGQVLVYNQDGRSLFTYDHDHYLSELLVSKDGKFVVSGSQDGTVRGYCQTSDGFEKICNYEHKNKKTVFCVGMSENCRYIASGGLAGEICVYDLGCKQKIKNIFLEGIIRNLAITNDAKNLLIGKENGAIIFYNLHENKEIDRKKHLFVPFHVCLTPSGKCFAVGGGSGVCVADPGFAVHTARYCEKEDSIKIEEAYKEMFDEDDNLATVMLSSNCKRFIAASQAGDITIYENPPCIQQRNMKLKRKKKTGEQIFQNLKDRIAYVQTSSSDEKDMFVIKLSGTNLVSQEVKKAKNIVVSRTMLKLFG